MFRDCDHCGQKFHWRDGRWHQGIWWFCFGCWKVIFGR